MVVSEIDPFEEGHPAPELTLAPSPEIPPETQKAQEGFVISLGNLASSKDANITPIPTSPESKTALNNLTRREKELLQLITAGLSNHEMASKLWITDQTVKFHLSNIYKKLSVTSREEAAILAMDHGLEVPDALPIAAIAALTKREAEVLEHASRIGLTAKLCQSLGISEQGVKYHLHNIYRKLGVQNKIEAIRAFRADQAATRPAESLPAYSQPAPEDDSALVETQPISEDVIIALGNIASSDAEITDSPVEPIKELSTLDVLTKREREILELTAQGLSNGEMAYKMWVTEQTIKFHLSNIYRKLNVSNRTEAAKLWADNKSVDYKEAIGTIEGLTTAEKDIYELLAKGMSSKEIAQLKGVSLQTVKFHLSNIYLKTGTRNRTEALRLLTGQPLEPRAVAEITTSNTASVSPLLPRQRPPTQKTPPVKRKLSATKEYASIPPPGANLEEDIVTKEHSGVFDWSFYMMSRSAYEEYEGGGYFHGEDLEVNGPGDPWENPFRKRVRETLANLKGLSLLTSHGVDLSAISGAPFNTLRRLMHENVITTDQFDSRILDPNSVVALLVFPQSWNLLRKGSTQRQAKRIINQEVYDYFATQEAA